MEIGNVAVGKIVIVEKSRNLFNDLSGSPAKKLSSNVYLLTFFSLKYFSDGPVGLVVCLIALCTNVFVIRFVMTKKTIFLFHRLMVALFFSHLAYLPMWLIW